MIKEFLKSLTPEQNKLMFYAFENDIMQFIVLNIDDFLGVNFTEKENFIITEKAGRWCCGKVTK